jgi:hypothetical protein
VRLAATLALVLAAPLAAQAPVVPDAIWKKLLALAISEGTFEPATETAPVASYVLEETETDPADDITTLKIRVLAARLPGGGVKTGAVLMTMIEVTHLPNNEAASNVWYFELSPSGQLQKVTHERSVAAASGAVKNSSRIVPLSDPEVRRIFQALLDYWSE